MPKLSEFFGIAIYMYWGDHGPPHFHARYSDQKASIAIHDLTVLTGRLSPRPLGLVVEWAALHQDELRLAWEAAMKNEPMSKIEPLAWETQYMLYDVVAAEARGGFKVWVRFEDGLEGEVDLSDIAGKGVFERWTADPSEFARVSVDPASGTLVWPGGLDVAPDRLYRDVTQAAGKDRSASRR